MVSLSIVYSFIDFFYLNESNTVIAEIPTIKPTSISIPKVKQQLT